MSWNWILLVVIVAAFCFVIYGVIYYQRNIDCKYFEGIPILIINDRSSCIAAINRLHSMNPIFVGIDCEWKSNIVRGGNQNQISLIQIGHEKLIILMRIHLFCNSIPIELISFLRDINIIKVGVGIDGDVKKLKNDYNVEVFGVVDINDIYDSSNYFGLEKLCNKLLNKSMTYKHKINHREWENVKLSQLQINYASDDAIVGYKIFKKIMEIQYEDKNIMEVCFGKIDINMKKQKKHRSKSRNFSRNNTSKKNHLESNGNIDMINLLSMDDEFLTLLSIKTAKQYLKKKWAQKISLDTIRMLIKVKPINIENEDLFNYQRVISLINYRCMICGHDKHENLMWFFLIYRYLYKLYVKSCDDPYKVLICKECNKNAVKWIHEYQEEICQLLLSENQRFKEIDLLFKTRNICNNLKHKKKLQRHSIFEQNEFVQQILRFCGIEKKIRETIIIKECDFNNELNIDWWYNNDYNYMLIRDCIEKIYKERSRTKKECNEWIKDSILKIFENRKVEFCEMWRNNFMKRMKPKFYNQKYPAFEFYVGSKKNMNNQRVMVEKQCKHKILDKNGDILTRTSIIFKNKILENDNYNVIAKRTNNKTIQLLNDIKTIDFDSDFKSDSNIFIVWIPLKDIKCYICKCEYRDTSKLRIFDVFPEFYYKQLFGDDDENGYNMQFYVPLCLECESKAIRINEEFELYLFLKYDIIKFVDDKEELFYAIKLSQKSERFRLSLDVQNDYISKILDYFNIIDIEIMIKECDCNKEMDVDWFYIHQYHYAVIKECIQKLIMSNSDLYRFKLSQMFKHKKLEFVQLWINNFHLETNKIKLSNHSKETAFQI